MKVLEGLSGVKSLLDHWGTPRELPPQLTWMYAHEPELLGWRIKARNYNTTIANGLLVVMLSIVFGLALYQYFTSVFEPGFSKTLIYVLFFFFISTPAVCMTHQRMNFAYRFTASGAEFCEWKNFPEWTLRFLTCLAIVTAILFACMASLDRDASYLIYAVIGPVKVMLLRASMNSKVYRGVHTIFHLRTFEWSEFTEVVIDKKQGLVGLEFAWYDNYMKENALSVAPLFAKCCELDHLLAFFEARLPHLPRVARPIDRAA
ncbi:hypothetical protein UIA24_18255 [Pseudomonas sp. AL 58]|uniref:hypothetical protein n=1 Tax=Pseudomonas sp. AL 58 TaxID=3104275 RepID=UPI002EB64E67|nr:hypothetical protein [Pseudomonas sp. AL 58]